MLLVGGRVLEIMRFNTESDFLITFFRKLMFCLVYFMTIIRCFTLGLVLIFVPRRSCTSVQ